MDDLDLSPIAEALAKYSDQAELQKAQIRVTHLIQDIVNNRSKIDALPEEDLEKAVAEWCGDDPLRKSVWEAIGRKVSSGWRGEAVKVGLKAGRKARVAHQKKTHALALERGKTSFDKEMDVRGGGSGNYHTARRTALETMAATHRNQSALAPIAAREKASKAMKDYGAKRRRGLRDKAIAAGAAGALFGGALYGGGRKREYAKADGQVNPLSDRRVESRRAAVLGKSDNEKHPGDVGRRAWRGAKWGAGIGAGWGAAASIHAASSLGMGPRGAAIGGAVGALSGAVQGAAGGALVGAGLAGLSRMSGAHRRSVEASRARHAANELTQKELEQRRNAAKSSAAKRRQSMGSGDIGKYEAVGSLAKNWSDALAAAVNPADSISAYSKRKSEATRKRKMGMKRMRSRKSSTGVTL